MKVATKPQVVHRNPCNRTLGLGADGLLVKVPKVRYKTLDLAIEVAKELNAIGTSTYKVVAYKCSECGQYHVGRNATLLKKKLVRQLRTEGYGGT